VAVNLAYELARMGGRIGLLDLDLYGPSLPLLVSPTDITVKRSSLGKGMIIPIHHHSVKLLSLGYVAPNVRCHGSCRLSIYFIEGSRCELIIALPVVCLYNVEWCAW
jgi:hypothetical protein